MSSCSRRTALKALSAGALAAASGLRLDSAAAAYDAKYPIESGAALRA